MSREIFQFLIPVIIGLFIFWLLYRINRRIARTVRDKIIDGFPNITTQLNNFQHKIDYLYSRVEVLERKINELEKREVK